MLYYLLKSTHYSDFLSFYSVFFLFQDPVLHLKTYIYFINIGLKANYNFLVQHIVAFLCLGTLHSTSALSLGAMSSSNITKENHKDRENVALSRLEKDAYLQ